jgi:biopolymer transport protein ExbD
MRFKGRMELEGGLKQVDIIPFVNVVFLLLLFFIFTPTFITQPSMLINLPKAVTSQAVNPGSLEIIVTSKNEAYFASKSLSLKELKELLAQAAKNSQSILIKADQSASLGRVTWIMDCAREIGIKHINIATNLK